MYDKYLIINKYLRKMKTFMHDRDGELFFDCWQWIINDVKLASIL